MVGEAGPRRCPHGGHLLQQLLLLVFQPRQAALLRLLRGQLRAPRRGRPDGQDFVMLRRVLNHGIIQGGGGRGAQGLGGLHILLEAGQ